MSKSDVHTNHHRKPRSLGGDDTARNVIRVPDKKHQAWHMLFSNLTPAQIAEVINATWLDPDYVLVAFRR